MDELIEFIKEYNDIQFLVSLDYNIEGYQTDQEYYSCFEWAGLYTDLGSYDNNPLILNGDPEHHIWHMFSGTTYSAYAFIDHNMIVRYLLDEPNLNDFKFNYIPELLLEKYGCVDFEDVCMPGDINFDSSIDVFDIVIIVEIILMEHFNYIIDMNFDGTINIIDIIDILNIIL